MNIQETAIAKLRQLPDPLAHLVNEFIDVLLNQWAKLSNQTKPPEIQPHIETNTPELEPVDYPSLKRVGSLWIVKATQQPDINWDTLVQDDRENRLNSIANITN